MHSFILSLSYVRSVNATTLNEPEINDINNKLDSLASFTLFLGLLCVPFRALLYRRLFCLRQMKLTQVTTIPVVVKIY
jgi:hypothetical protein